MLKKSYKYFNKLFLLFAILTLIKCSGKNKNEISDEIVLKVNNFEMTKYEFEKIKKSYLKYSDNKVSSDDLKNFNNQIIDEAYILADAYNKRYDTLSEINKIVYYEKLFLIGKEGGYVWKKFEEPKLVFTNNELKEAYKKRNNVFYLEYLFSQNYDVLKKTLKSDTIIKNELSFHEKVEKYKSYPIIKYINAPYRWPFDEMFDVKDIIYGLKSGEVSKPLITSEGVYIIHIIQIENMKQQKFKDEKENIRSILRKAKALKIILNKQNEIRNKASYQINDSIADELLKNIEPDLNRMPENKSFMDKIIMKYYLNKQLENVTSREVLEFFKYLPYKYYLIDNKNHLHECLKDYVICKYMYKEADSLGILDDKQYKLNIKDYLNKTINQKYIQNELLSNIIISQQEINDYYKKNMNKFMIGKIAYVTILTFKNKQIAEQNWKLVCEQIYSFNIKNLSDTSIIKGLISYQPNIIIEKDNKEYPEAIIKNIFELPENIVSIPMECKDKCIVYYKTKEKGKRIKSLDEAADEIKLQLKEQKVMKMRNDRIKELKGKYRITINKL